MSILKSRSHCSLVILTQTFFLGIGNLGQGETNCLPSPAAAKQQARRMTPYKNVTSCPKFKSRSLNYQCYFSLVLLNCTMALALHTVSLWRRAENCRNPALSKFKVGRKIGRVRTRLTRPAPPGLCTAALVSRADLLVQLGNAFLFRFQCIFIVSRDWLYYDHTKSAQPALTLALTCEIGFTRKLSI